MKCRALSSKSVGTSESVNKSFTIIFLTLSVSCETATPLGWPPNGLISNCNLNSQ